MGLFAYLEHVNKNIKTCNRKDCPKVFMVGNHTPLGDVCSDCNKEFYETLENAGRGLDTYDFYEDTFHDFMNISPGDSFNVEELEEGSQIISVYSFLMDGDDLSDEEDNNFEWDKNFFERAVIPPTLISRDDKDNENNNRILELDFNDGYWFLRAVTFEGITYNRDIYPECQGDFGKGSVFTKKNDGKVNFLGFSLTDENSLTVIVSLDIPDGNMWDDVPYETIRFSFPKK